MDMKMAETVCRLLHRSESRSRPNSAGPRHPSAPAAVPRRCRRRWPRLVRHSPTSAGT